MDAEAPEAVEVDPVWRFSIPNAVPLGPPIIAVNDVSFDYTPVLPDGSKKAESEFLLQEVKFGITLTSKIAILGANGMYGHSYSRSACVFVSNSSNSLLSNRYGKDNAAESHHGKTQTNKGCCFNQPQSPDWSFYAAFR